MAVLTALLIVCTLALAAVRTAEFVSLVCLEPIYIGVFLFMTLVFFRSSLGLRVLEAGIFLAVMKQRVDRDVFVSDVVLTGRVAVVTGANSGIGLALAQDLLQRQARVILACRSLRKCEQVKPPGGECMELDLGDLDSVRSFAAALRARADITRVDFLVNNAGLVAGWGEKTKQGFEANWGIMHLGHFLLTRELLPLLTGARVVNHASAAMLGGELASAWQGDLHGEGVKGCGKTFTEILADRTMCPLTGAYSRAKLSQVLFTKELAQRLAPKGVTTCTLHPGEVQSGIANVTTALVRPTVVGAQVLLKCVLGDIPSGSYIDEMGGVHNLRDTWAGWRFSYASAVVLAHEAAGADAQRLWSLTDGILGGHALPSDLATLWDR